MIAKHKNGRYYKCQVIDIQVQVFYEVDFAADGSFSRDLFPEDIVVRLSPQSVFIVESWFVRAQESRL